MFPLRDDNPTLSRAVVTIALIALNCLVWLGVQRFGTEPAITASVCAKRRPA